MYTIHFTSQFRRDLKRVQRRGYDLRLLQRVIDLLAAGEELEGCYGDHRLVGNWEGCRECHVTPDWLLVYRRAESLLILYLMRTGTHSDLFRL